MQHKEKILLGKILSEIQMSMDLLSHDDITGFISDEKEKRAVCMSVINVGEFIKLLDMQIRKEHPEIPWKQMAGFRDIVAHTYHALRMEDVFTTVKDEFPDIQKGIQKILDNFDNDVKDDSGEYP